VRVLPVLLVLTISVMGSASADPALFHPGTGVPNPAQGDTRACWSEPPDLNGLVASSEQILIYGLESETANDFVPTDTPLTHVTFWGGAYNNSTPCQAGSPVPGLNLRFYEDAGCVPGALFAEIYLVAGQYTEESAGCQSGMYPLYKWGADVSVDVVASSLIWFSGQIADHAFPPQFGRLATSAVTGCDSMFRCAYLGYPDWTNGDDGVGGFVFDVSQEFECGGAVPARESSWGRIKSTFR
jgi:hypothetical protein